MGDDENLVRRMRFQRAKRYPTCPTDLTFQTMGTALLDKFFELVYNLRNSALGINNSHDYKNENTYMWTS